MRYLTPLIAVPFLMVLGACAILQATPQAEVAREKIVDGLNLYCTQPQVVRQQNRDWINANSPHRIEVTCAADVPTS